MITEGQWEEVKTLSHTIGGSAANSGAIAIAAICDQIKALSPEGRESMLDLQARLPQALTDFREAYEAFIEEVSN